MRIFFYLFLTIFLPATNLTAQTGIYAKTPFSIGVTDTLHSLELGENRILNIYLPEGYRPESANTYPVIYLLDGSANEDFIHIVGIVQFLHMVGAMPASIVVGIANVDRRRDFTFATTVSDDKKDFPTSGGSAKFIRFIEKELQPYIQKNYSHNQATTIIGQSLGGLLAAEILLKKPGLFNKYLIVSPSLWWDNGSLLAGASKLLKNAASNTVKAYISVGTEGKQMEADAKKLSVLLQSSGNKNLTTTFLAMPRYTHLTILHNSAYKGLELLNER